MQSNNNNCVKKTKQRCPENIKISPVFAAHLLDFSFKLKETNRFIIWPQLVSVTAASAFTSIVCLSHVFSCSGPSAPSWLKKVSV